MTFKNDVVKSLAKNQNSLRVSPWGFSFTTDNEIDALRITYSYRFSKHGFKIEHNEVLGTYLVTIFNEHAKSMGIDC